jgi:hypothetical protein
VERPERLGVGFQDELLPLLATTTITTKLTREGNIQQIVEMRSNLTQMQYYTQVLQVREDQIKIALIALGWTPPVEQK